MNENHKEIVAVLTAISEVAAKLAPKGAPYEQLSLVAKRIAQLEQLELSEDTIMVILCSEGLITKEQLQAVL